MKDIQKLLLNYYNITDFSLDNLEYDRTQEDLDYKQTAANCRIYSVLENTYLNTGLYVKGLVFENIIEEYGIDNTQGGQTLTAGLILADYLEDKEIDWYEIDLIDKKYWEEDIILDKHFNMENVKLFGKLLRKGIVFSYSRKSGAEILNDIKDGVLDEEISKNNDGRHATNIYFKKNRLNEIGTRGKYSLYNRFIFNKVNLFMKSIKNKTIKPTVRFMFWKQERPYTYYRNKMLGSRVDYDRAYGYQCVDLFKHYCREVLGITYGKTGNANQIWYNTYKIFGKDWKQIPGTDDLMQGDILVSLVGRYGHIGIFDHYGQDGKVYLLEQNGSGSIATNGTNGDEIRVHGYNKSFFAGVWRNKTIETNYKKEMIFVKNKINTKGLDKVTSDYVLSIRKS